MVDIRQKAKKTFIKTVKTPKVLSDDLLDKLTYFVRSSAYIRKNDNVVDRNKEVFSLSRNDETYEVKVTSDITLDDYRALTPKKDWDLLVSYAEQLKGKSVVFINPTMEGGGVAMLRPPLVHLFKLFGIHARWYVMAGRINPLDPNPFIFTKRMHNISQRRTGPDVRLTNEMIATHQQWNKENAEVLKRQKPIVEADVIVIDDPQPAPLIPLLKTVNPKAKWVWRNHIDTDGALMADPTTPQGELAKYLLETCGIKQVDAVITHPVKAFVHPALDSITYFAPATVEPHDDLNKPLSRKEIKEGIDFINTEIIMSNREFASIGLRKDIQRLINPKRRRIVLVARFDESKGMDKAMKLGVMVRRAMRKRGFSGLDLPQIIILGNGSVDDPSGVPLFMQMLEMRRAQKDEDRKDIIVMRLRHNYKAMNALMYPTPSRKEKRTAPIVALQTSEAEGCETRISDWIRHGVPVVVSNRGGMSLQVFEHKSGLVLNYKKPDFDLKAGAAFITKLMTDDDTYSSIRKTTLECAEDFNNREFTTTANATRFLRIFDHILTGKPADKSWKVSKMKPDQ